MEKLIKVGIFFFLFASVVLTDCPLARYPRKTTIGYINAQINKSPSLHNTIINYQYMLGQQLTNSSLNVAIGVVGLQFNLDGIVEFNIAYFPTNSLTTIRFDVFLYSLNNGWNRLKFNFFATQSSLFQVGSITTNQFSVGKQKGKYIIYRPLPKINGGTDSNNLQLKIFLNGVKLKQRILGQQFKQMSNQFESFKSFSSNPKLIQYFKQALQNQQSNQLKLSNVRTLSNIYTFTIQATSDLSSLSYSYVFFAIKATKEMHNYITDTMIFSNSDQYKFNSLQNMDMLMTGLTGFQVPSKQLYYFELKFSDLGGKSYFQLNTNYKYFNLQVSFLAVDLKIAFSCQQCPNSPIIYENKLCVEQCPRSYSLTQQFGVKLCERCDIERLKVVDLSSGKCVCAKRHFLDTSSKLCQPCSYDCMTCDRVDRCLTCDNTLLQTKRKIGMDGKCACPLIGYYDDKYSEDIICQKCHQKCLTCNGPKQHHCLTCSPSKQRDSLGFCVCKNGFAEDLSGNCVCLPPKILNQNNLCLDFTTPCATNQVQQFVNLVRRCICKSGFHTIVNECIKCNQLAVFNPDSLKCECPKFTVEVNGQCKSCQTNKVYDETSKLCICADGTFEAKDGSCKNCPQKMVLMEEVCECVFNYYEESPGVCRRCKSELDGPKCKRNIS